MSRISLNYYLSLFLLAVYTLPSFAQDGSVEDPKTENQIERLVEQIAEANEEDEVDYVTLLDVLSNYAENPLNLNTAKRSELEQLQLLDEVQINNLLAHIEKHGKLITFNELQTVDGFNMVTIRTIEPFVSVNADFDRPRLSFKELFKNGKSQFFIRYQQILEEQQGYSAIDDSSLLESPNSRYIGSPYKLYSRYRFNYSTNLSVGFTMEKDQGEEFFQGSQKNGFDFYSAHFFVKDMGKLKALAIGDFQAQFGQGLTFWSGLAFGKTADGTGIKRNAVGLRPYASVEENRFLRGVGTAWELGNFELTAFFSSKKIDANVAEVDTTNDEISAVSSFFGGGFHRTPSELEDKDAIRETIYGGRLAFNKRTLKIGVTGINYNFSSSLLRSDNLYNYYEFTGSQNSNYGLDFNYIIRNFNFFGEASVSQNGAYAYLAGALISLDPNFTLSVMHRNLKPDYQAVYANAVTESSRMNNESGTYFGFSAKPTKNWIATGYIDFFRFPWLRFRVNAPSSGYEYLAQLTFKPSKKLEAYFRVRQQNKPINTSEEVETIEYIDDDKRTNYRFNITYKISPSIKLRNRVEYVRYKNGNQDLEQGFLVYQDVYYKALSSPVSFSFRYALFDTESYSARIYAYENDVLYAYSIPAYYFKGSRTYLTLRYTPVSGIDIWLRYSNTFFNNQKTISSGLNQSEGSIRSEIKAQIRFKF